MMPRLGEGYDDGKSFYGIYEYVVDLENIIVDILNGIKRHDIEAEFGLSSERCDDIYEVYTRILEDRKRANPSS